MTAQPGSLSRWRRANAPADDRPESVPTPAAPTPLDNPYVGPRPFETKDRANFYGRFEEMHKLAALIIARQAVVLYAQSGAGKTSLIQASLIPHLQEKEKLAVLPFSRVGGDVPSGLDNSQVKNIYVFNALLNMARDTTQPQALLNLNLSDGLAGPLANQKGPTLLVLDQFEEMFTTHPERYAERADFFRQLQACLNNYPHLSLLLALREDYIAHLDSYAGQLPDRLRARFRLERLGYRAALEAVKAPAQRAGRPFGEGVAESLVVNLAGLQGKPESNEVEAYETIMTREEVAVADPLALEDYAGIYIEPVHLQIVCHQLWEKLPTDRQLIGFDDVEQFGDVDQALTGFYESALLKVLEQTNLSERRLRTWFDTQLITPARTRSLVYRDETKKETEGLPNTAIDILTNTYLIRADKRGRDTWYELAHDRLIGPVIEANRVWLARYQNPLTQAAEAWRAAGKNPDKLLKDEPLQEALQQLKTNPAELTELEKEFVNESAEAHRRKQLKRNRLMALGASALVIIFAGLAAWTWQQRAFAEDRRVAAETAQARAGIAKEEAEAARTIAEDRRVAAETAQAQASIAEATAEAAQTIAETDRDEAEVLRLAAAANQNLVDDPNTSLLLAIHAIRKAHLITDTEIRLGAEDALYQAIQKIEGGTQGFLFSHTGGVKRLAFSPDGRYLASAGADREVIIWDLEENKEQARLLGHGDEVMGLAFSPDGTRLATASADSTARVWDFLTGQEILTLGHYTRSQEPIRVNDVAFSPDGAWLATGDDRGEVRIWEADSGQVASFLLGHSDEVLSLKFAPDGVKLATSSADNTTILWDSRSGAKLLTLAGHTNVVQDVAFSPDGRLLATASDVTPKVWDLQTGKRLFTLSGHKAEVRSIIFSADGLRLATASADGTAKVWNIDKSGKSLTLLGDGSGLTVATFSPDPSGNYLAIGSDAGNVRLLTLELGQLLDRACNLASRNLTQGEWETYIAGDDAYRPTCSNQPVHTSALLEYVRQGEPGIQTALTTLAISPTEVIKALIVLGQEQVTEGGYNEAVAALDQARALDPQLELGQIQDMVRIYNQLCNSGPWAASDMVRARAACQEAIALAGRTGDFALNNDICRNGQDEALAEFFLPACQRAVELAITTDNPGFLARVCLNNKVESLAAVVAPACRLLPADFPMTATGEFALPVRFVDSPNYNNRRTADDISAVVMHATGNADLNRVINWFNDPSAQISSHYTIDKDGVIVQHVQEEKRAWHAGRSQWQDRDGLNDWSIGIQLINLNDGEDPYPEAQHRAAVQLVAYLTLKYNISLENILANYDVALPAGRKDDPRGYDMEQLRQDVNTLINSGIQPAATETVPTTPSPTPTPLPTLAPTELALVVSDGFDFPVGPRGTGIDVFATYVVSAGFLDSEYLKSFGVWQPGEMWNGRGGGDTDLGDPVYAVSRGRVAEIASNLPNWGNIVLLEHQLDDGSQVWSQYAHLDQILVTEVGQIVQRGQQIGTIGKGEKNEKFPQGRLVASLHFEIRRADLPINNWLPMVRDQEAVLANYHNPTDFINAHRPEGASPALPQVIEPTAIPTPTSVPSPPPVTPTPTLSPTPGASSLVYVQIGTPSRDAWKHALAILPADNSEQIGLPIYAAAPAWSPDGKRVAFFFEEDNPAEVALREIYRQGSGIWTVDDQGHNSIWLAEANNVQNMVWSPDGSSLAYEEIIGSRREIIIIGSGDGRSIARFEGEQPTWSPDGQELVIRRCCPQGLWRVNRQGEGEPLTTGGDDAFPFWSPTGESLVYSTLAPDSGGLEIYRLDLANGQQQRLTNRPGTDTTPVFSRDGQRVYFLTNSEGDWQINVINIDGSDERSVRLGVGPRDSDQPWGLARPAVY